jgi:hypothetical protein
MHFLFSVLSLWAENRVKSALTLQIVGTLLDIQNWKICFNLELLQITYFLIKIRYNKTENVRLIWSTIRRVNIWKFVI